MKTFCKILIIFYFAAQGMCTRAEDGGLNAELSSGSNVFGSGFTGQKQITDTKFKKTVEELKERALTKKQKKIKKQVQPNEPAYDIKHLKELTQEQDSETGLPKTMTVMIPAEARSEEGIYIPAGYYKLSYRKISENDYVLDLSQGASRMLTIKAYQTAQDLEQQEIIFCGAKVLPDGRIRLMYGNPDLNLAGYIYYKT